MIKSILLIFFAALVLLWGGAKGWTGQDLEDRFLNPDFDTSKSIFLDVKDASLINVLKIISQQTGLSFISSHDVDDRKITVYLNKVPLNQALQMILDANGLAYQMQEDSNVFVVTPKLEAEKAKITKVYQLKYATVSTSKLNSTLGNGGGSAATGTSGLEAVLKDSLSKDGKVVQDPRTNSLIITDVPGQFDIIDNTVTRLDVPVPQILIEVEMIDVSKGTGDQLGIAYGTTSFTPLQFLGGGSKSTGWPFGPGGNTSQSSQNLTSSSSSSSSSSSGSSSGSTTNGVPTTGFTTSNMTATLNFLATQTDSRTLARPRILTLNNETAQIEISTDQAISVQETSATTGTTSSTLNAVTPERYTTGVILKVTPQANLLTREVTMAVSPKVVDVIPSTIQAGGQTIYDPETRGSDSMLKLRDGQTMVIGGLLRNESSKSTSKLPLLGDLPLVGAAFRSTITKKTERELLIFLTPHIIDDSAQGNFKGVSSPVSVQAALDIQNADDHALEINNSLNNLDTK